MLSTTTEYALRIMIALTEVQGEPMTSEEVALRTSVSSDYAVKVLQQMARAKMVIAQRGRRGGFRLACDPTRTTLLDVVNVIEPIERIKTCPLGRTPPRSRLCSLHSRIDNAIATLQQELGSLTLHDVTTDDDRRALCPRETSAVLSVSATRKSRRK